MFQSPMTILLRLGLGLANGVAAAGRSRALYRKTLKDDMSTKSRSLKLMAPSRAGPLVGILKLKTAPALIMSVAERMRSDKANNIALALPILFVIAPATGKRMPTVFPAGLSRVIFLVRTGELTANN